MNTDDYEGHTPAPWTIEHGDMEKGETDTVMSSEGEVAMNVMRQDVALLADAPLLLAEVKRSQKREIIITEQFSFLVEHQTEEVKRLREAIADVANNMEAADGAYMRGFIEDLMKAVSAKFWVVE
jgi:hypothetical protein